MFNKAMLVCLAIWALLFGIFSVTNLQVEWGKPLMGFAALILGIVCIAVLIQKVENK